MKIHRLCLKKKHWGEVSRKIRRIL